MNKSRLKFAAEKLELLANEAIAAGYMDAAGMVKGQIFELIQLSKAEKIESPIKIGTGFDRAFSETRLGECIALEAAWQDFVWLIGDYDSRPDIIADKMRNGGRHADA